MKLLYVTGLSGKRINGFMRSAIHAAKEMDIDFTMVSNMTMADKEGYKEDCKEYGIKALHIDLDRNPLGRNNKKAHDELCKIIVRGGYDVIHCNTPTGGVLGRVCTHEINKERIKKGEKPIYVIYQAHGFHFWKGAPKKNWLVFYPVEKFLARWTDMLITINQEDYRVAQTFKLRENGKAILHPGVGVNIKDFQEVDVDRDKKRAELGVKPNQVVFLNVGELIDRKNHKVLLQAMKKLNNPQAVLLIAGDGEKKEELEKDIHDLGLEKSVKLLGYRTDVKELLKAADCFLFPSYQEGLPGALMEAMASGLPCIASNIRGNTDALQDSGFMFSPDDVDGLVELMKVMFDSSSRIAEGKANEERVKRFDISKSIEAYKTVYSIAEDAIR